MSDGEFAALFLLTVPFAALIPAVIAQSKGRSFLGFYVYGFFLLADSSDSFPSHGAR